MPLLPSYKGSVEPFLPRYIIETLTKENEVKIANFLMKSYKAYTRKQNGGVGVDTQRWTNMKLTLMGEAALEQFLNTSFIQYSLNDYGEYRSNGINGIRIKVFQEGQFPIIYQRNTDDMIFIMQAKSTTFRICGLATRQMLNSYQSKQLVPETEPYKQEKACFYGFEELKSFTDLAVLKKIFG